MSTLRKNIAFNVPDSNDVVEKTIDYFTQSGFKLLDKGENILTFGRGSILSNMWTFNPLQWKSEVKIEIVNQKVIANFEVNTTGQKVTLKEENLWDKFINNFKRQLTEQVDFKPENSKALQATKRNSLKWVMMGVLIGGVPAGLIASLTGINSVISIGAIGGAIGFLILKINNERSKNDKK
ncbi:hypothetical protein AAG747_26735 [Rapidithrix thailandica]|uniref:Uncharacterized protein n=1 Tax=Rapidithrix thailandica TaxID=413964 RepID=A0AAW9SLB6_9BACT